jgi:outer membrane protein
LWSALALGSVLTFGQTKIGVIHIQKAMVSTKDGQKAVADLEAKRAPKTKVLEGQQNEIRKLQDSLNRGGNAMAEGAKRELMGNIDAKTKSFNRDLEDAQAEWDQDQQKVLQDLGQKMTVVIDKFAKDNGYSMIVDISNPNGAVLYASSAIDVTNEIIALYDKAAAAPATSAAPPAAKPTAPTPSAAKPPAATPGATKK